MPDEKRSTFGDQSVGPEQYRRQDNILSMWVVGSQPEIVDRQLKYFQTRLSNTFLNKFTVWGL